jgi:hypothetical protein
MVGRVMPFNIPVGANDDPQFAGLVSKVTSGIAERLAPQEIHIIEIENWFDHKWLKFSGKGRVKFEGNFVDVDTALYEFRQDQVTFPPFSPSRVIEEYLFLRSNDNSYLQSEPAFLVHSHERASSSRNLHRRVADFSRSGVFVWFSSDTQVTRRGSLMVYEVSGREVRAWFAAFFRKGAWKLLQTDNIAREQVEALMGQSAS